MTLPHRSRTSRMMIRAALFGFGGPGLIVRSPLHLSPLRPGESVKRAWNRTNERISETMKTINGSPRRTDIISTD